jgi:hypothetical protein
VRASAGPPAPPGAGSFAAWAPGDGDERARVAAWPAAFGLPLRFATADDARRGVAALGARLIEAEASVGAVLPGPGAVAPPERVPLAPSARARRSRHELVALACHLVEGPPPGPPCPWFAPADGEAYVVPRLGALARRAEFVDDVRRALRDGRADAHYYDGGRAGFERARAVRRGRRARRPTPSPPSGRRGRRGARAEGALQGGQARVVGGGAA